jgi:4-amino-4-deoxy-L-arabinose transferase-like glycosyltransferase
MSHQAPATSTNFLDRYGSYLAAFLVAIFFFLYTYGLSENPPGFYRDESAFAYNAYLIAKTGAGEFGVHWPLYFQNFTEPFTNYANPVAIYLLAGLYLVLPPSIWLSRLLSATAGLEAGVLLGLLAFKISRDRTIGIIVGLTALITPWFFEVSRLFFDSSFYPLALALFLLALYSASTKDRWTWGDTAKVALTLALLTYTYTIGRLLAPLLALGLIFFVTNRRRLVDVLRTWIAYGLTLIPLLVFNLRHPGMLTSRFQRLTYVYTEPTLPAIIRRFITRYFQDLSMWGLLTTGDGNPRHHVPGATGSMLAAPFILALMGILIVVMRHRRDPWWRFIIFGALASIIPGALTVDAFHTGRLIAYPVFLLVLTIPALKWLFGKDTKGEHLSEISAGNQSRLELLKKRPRVLLRRALLVVFLLATIGQAAYFQVIFWREGPNREYLFDVAYKHVYDVATTMPSRPIYLVDGQMGPGYIHALWYALLEGRDASEFVHLDYGVSPPPGALVISSEQNCTNCEVLFTSGQFFLYRKR